MTSFERFRVSTSGQMSLPAAARRRWDLERGGPVEVLDLDFGVLVLPEGGAGHLLDLVYPADAHYAFVEQDDDPDLQTT